MAKNASRYEEVSRRALLKGSLGLGAVALLPSIACGSENDAQVFAGALAAPASSGTVPTTAPVQTPATAETLTEQSGQSQVSPPESSAPEASPSAEPEPTAEPSPQPTAETPTPEQAPLRTALLEGAVLVVDFSYVQDAGGKNVPPYIAVWLEDSSGDLVDTIELWYQQDRKGARWLPDLRRWFSVDQSRIRAGGPNTVDVVSSATRIAGSYSVAWDGLLAEGQAPTGEYFICIESARERGPYSLIREPMTLDGSLTDRVLSSNGELQSSRVSVRV